MSTLLVNLRDNTMASSQTKDTVADSLHLSLEGRLLFAVPKSMYAKGLQDPVAELTHSQRAG
jgi:hypothetical protein